jgi:dihydrolipoamide dehydrogenase
VAESFDVVIIGAGPGGYVAAIVAAQAGLKTALIERSARLGGTCGLVGCIPTKALLRTAEIMDNFQHAKEFGIDVPSFAINFVQAYKRKEDVVNKNADGVVYLMKKNKITVLRGAATFTGKKTLDVKAEDGKVTNVEAKNVIIATGSVPRVLPGIEPDHKVVVTSDSILSLTKQPKSLIVLGAGAVGMEFASVFKSFGSECTVVEMAPHLLPVEDEEVSKEIEREYRKRGIAFHVDAKVEKVEKKEGGVKVTLKKGDETVVLEAEMLLSAAGRAPFTDGLGLDKVPGVKKNARGYIAVDGMMRTGEPGIFAIGDVVSVNDQPHPMLAHVASYEAHVAADFIAGKNPQPVNYNLVPGATYCAPEVASVGLTEKKAREKGYDVKIGKFPFSAIGKARVLGETWGFVKIVADKKYDEVLGVHIIGPHATELIHELCLGMRLETTVEEIEKTMHAHPTLSEAVLEAAHAAMGHTLHM